MKNMTKAFAIAIAMFGFAAGSFAQATATATASATIIKPITIAKTVDMVFGNIVLKAGSTGTVVLGTDDVATPSTDVTLPLANRVTPTAAKFDIGGEATYTYFVTLPSSIELSDGVSATMTVDNITNNISTNAGLLSAEGTQELIVGGTLNLEANQTAGTYTSTAFDVVVNYN